MKRQRPKWLAKDILVLFYEDGLYQEGVQAFLNEYYSTSKISSLEARCGYIRTALPLIVDTLDFNKVSLRIEGINTE